MKTESTIKLGFAVMLLLIGSTWVGQSFATDLDSVVSVIDSKYTQLCHINAEELSREEGLLIFDVREDDEFRVSHLQNARQWKGLQDALRDIGQSKPRMVVLYCSVGERSSKAALQLKEASASLAVANLRGGIFRWAIEHRPMVNALGELVSVVHPYDAIWGRLLPKPLRGESKRLRP